MRSYREHEVVLRPHAIHGDRVVLEVVRCTRSARCETGRHEDIDKRSSRGDLELRHRVRLAAPRLALVLLDGRCRCGLAVVTRNDTARECELRVTWRGV